MVTGTLAGVMATAVLAGVGVVAGDGAEPRYWMRVGARFAPPTAFIPSSAITYDMKLVPAGSAIEVEQRSRPGGPGGRGVRGARGGMAVTVRVEGLKPGHAYGAHVHQKACGADPEAAGGHYQHREDPEQPSKDPAFLNPRNEVWLDFTAGPDGSGEATARHDWEFRAGGAGSVVLHREPGGAGDRVACFTVPLVSGG
ncbi:superoxide dismutase family protein [Streptomyces longisporoflavus]|uniref:Superoxide dismutase family protein n=1 Tax=Streptomyces longisporoflavus TaxID=28044 RepID=A0ABW7QLB6_9ACTN